VLSISAVEVTTSNPGGNITGYMFIEASLASKWPDLMRAIAPQVSRVGLLFNPATAPYARYYRRKFHPAAATLHGRPES
jgi:putative ABC transport system substrate-binding protein